MFQRAVNEGVLAECEMRGLKFSLVEVKLHADPLRRGAGQIMPTVRRLMFASFLAASPVLLQPIHNLKVFTSEDTIGEVYAAINSRQGVCVSEKWEGRNIELEALLPVREMFGLAALLRYTC
jgi:elongation factor 2